MRYAGGVLNWSGTDILEWFSRYPRPHPAFPDDFFPEEIHFLVCLSGGQRIRESGLARLPAKWGCDGFKVPQGRTAGICDVKLAKEFWGAGYGTEAMFAVARFFRERTSLDTLIVPPHRESPAAIRVYEKAGFVMTEGRAWGDHLIMVMER